MHVFMASGKSQKCYKESLINFNSAISKLIFKNYKMQTGEATVENSMEFPQKTKNGIAL